MFLICCNLISFYFRDAHSDFWGTDWLSCGLVQCVNPACSEWLWPLPTLVSLSPEMQFGSVCGAAGSWMRLNGV